MRVLVLGGAGYIGRAIVERLVLFEHDVAVLRRGNQPAGLPDRVVTIYGDRNELDRSIEDFRRFRPDLVIDVIAYVERQAQSLVSVFRGVAKRAVVFSSGDVYRANDILFGRVSGGIEPTPLRESSPLRDRLYSYRGITVPPVPGFSWDDYEKILVERAVLNNPDLPATVLRLPMVYGPGDYSGVKRRFWAYQKRMDEGRNVILLDRPTAQWRAPLGYSGDIAEAVRLAVECEDAAGEVYNVCDPDALDTQSWVRALAAAVEWRGEIVVVDQPCPPPNLPRSLNPGQHLDMDSTKIRRDLGYRETVSRREGLRETAVWDRLHAPLQMDPAQFDYASEDAILLSVHRERP